MRTITKVVTTTHAKERLTERRISRTQIIEAIKLGKRESNDTKNSSTLISRYDGLSVVYRAYSNDVDGLNVMQVITAYND